MQSCENKTLVKISEFTVLGTDSTDKYPNITKHFFVGWNVH